ncbi:MAG: hypothetical protein MR448_08420 [Parabacteroides sp.]|nr:hypothetical protein [Parabacteroides sp.]MDD7061921.1 hypothetical protein [bacterium]
MTGSEGRIYSCPVVYALFNLILSAFSVRLLLFILPSHRTECHSIERSLEGTVEQSQKEGEEVLEVYSNASSMPSATERHIPMPASWRWRSTAASEPSEPTTASRNCMPKVGRNCRFSLFLSDCP